MTFIEAAAALLGLINIVLVVRRSVWNFPFGLVMVALYAWLFIQPNVRLYSDAGLQVFFFAVQLYGWRNWARSQAAAGEVKVRPLARTAWWGMLAGVAVASLVWGTIMHQVTDAALPWFDAFIAMGSVAAQLLMARRVLENWYLWIAVDIVAIGVFTAKGLMITSFLYIAFLMLSVTGLQQWRKAMAQ